MLGCMGAGVGWGGGGGAVRPAVKDLSTKGFIGRFDILLKMLLFYIHRNHKAYYGQEAQDGNLDLHTALSLGFDIIIIIIYIYAHCC